MPSDKTTRVCAARARKFEKFYLLNISAANFSRCLCLAARGNFSRQIKRAVYAGSVCELHVIRCGVVRRKEGQSSPRRKT
jgi:hypothetical protein